MSYVEKNLLPGETVGYRTHLHPVIFLQPVLFALVGLGFVVFGLLNPPLSAFWMLGLVFLIFAAGLGIDRAVRYVSSEFVITNKRVLIKVGFINRHTVEMLLPKLETIRVEQGILARLLNFGTIVLTGTGGTNEPFRLIADPLEFRRQVQARAAG